jgi:hypothetical protein
MQAEGGKPNVTHPVSNYSWFDFFFTSNLTTRHIQKNLPQAT